MFGLTEEVTSLCLRHEIGLGLQYHGLYYNMDCCNRMGSLGGGQLKPLFRERYEQHFINSMQAVLHMWTLDRANMNENNNMVAK